MINLLPPEYKQELRYARRNRFLVYWIAALIVAIVGAGLITAGGVIIMNSSIANNKTQAAKLENQLLNQHINEAEKQVTGISNNLKLMVKVFSKEVLFSKLLDQLASITPSNAVLTNLTISKTQSGIDITAQTASYNAATQLQINMIAPTNKIFSKADIVNITCSSGAQVVNKSYPCTADIRAQFTNNNPFLFINANGT